MSSQHHSWLYTTGPGGKTGGIIFYIWEWYFITAVGIHVACHYPAVIQLCSNGSHQQRHGGCRPSDVGGARVNHSRAALGAEHHVRPHWDAGEKRDAMGNLASARMRTCGLFAAYLPLHRYFPFARLFCMHVVKTSSVVVGVRASEH